MSISIEEVRKVFQYGFKNDSTSLSYEGNALTQNGDYRLWADIDSKGERKFIAMRNYLVESAVLNLPDILKMLLDTTDEIDRLKLENDQLRTQLERSDSEYELNALRGEMRDLIHENKALREEIASMSFRGGF